MRNARKETEKDMRKKRCGVHEQKIKWIKRMRDKERRKGKKFCFRGNHRAEIWGLIVMFLMISVICGYFKQRERISTKCACVRNLS